MDKHFHIHEFMLRFWICNIVVYFMDEHVYILLYEYIVNIVL